MVTLFDRLVIVLVFALFQQRAEAASSIEKNRVSLAYNAAYDNCKEVTETTGYETRTAADKMCERAFNALDEVGLNTCNDWREAGCRLVSRQDKHRQCTCLASYSEDYSYRKSCIVRSFRDCAPVLQAEEEAGKIPTPSINFQKKRSYYDTQWQEASSKRQARSYPGPYSGSGSAIAVHTTSGAGTSKGTSGAFDYGNLDVPNTSYAPGASGLPSQDYYPCDECGAELRSGRARFLHKIAYHYVCGMRCYLCGASFNYKRGLVEHLRVRHSEEEAETHEIPLEEVDALMPFPCQFCKKRYRSRHGLTDHLRSHLTDDTKCPVCKRVYSTRAILKAHMEDCHPGVPMPERTAPSKVNEPETGPFKCRECGKEYAHKKGLKSHEKRHNSVETVCGDCDRVYESRHSYMTHLKLKHPEIAKIHEEIRKKKQEEERQVMCGICHIGFKNVESLREHMGCHTGKTTCDICGKKLARRTSLYNHKKNQHPKN